MSNELDQIRADIGELREAKGTLTANVATLATSVATLTASVNTLNNTLQRGRGALWAIVTASTAMGGLVAWIISLLVHK
jgi:hypothetical protein